MIISTLSNSEKLRKLHLGFGAAFEFLQQDNLADLADGTVEISGRKVYAMISTGQGKGKDAARLELHRRYIDIQYTLEGTELIGCGNNDLYTPDAAGWNEEKDICFLDGTPEFWLPVPQGSFAVFYPMEDAHAPLAANGAHRKIVLKIEA